MVDRPSTEHEVASSPPSAPEASRLRTWLAGGGIAALLLLILWPGFRRNRIPLDTARWNARDDREAMADDVLRIIDDGGITDESTAEAHLGKPDGRRWNARNERAWWYDLDSRGRRYLLMDFDSTGRLTSRSTGPPGDND
jgi:hypothetical protein